MPPTVAPPNGPHFDPVAELVREGREHNRLLREEVRDGNERIVKALGSIERKMERTAKQQQEAASRWRGMVASAGRELKDPVKYLLMAVLTYFSVQYLGVPMPSFPPSAVAESESP